MQAEKYPEKNNKKDRINRKSVQVKHTLWKSVALFIRIPHAHLDRIETAAIL